MGTHSNENHLWQNVEDKAGKLVSSAEFPGNSQEEAFSLDQTDPSRRDFLKVMGFSVGALTVGSGCSKIPEKKVYSYADKQTELTPGIPNFYASTCDSCDEVHSVVVRTREGRPIKLEGNELSTLDRGGLCARGQASVLELYDSNRFRSPLLDGKEIGLYDLDKKIFDQLAKMSSSGKKILLVTRPSQSPSRQKIINQFFKKYSGGVLNIYEPAGTRQATIAAIAETFQIKGLPEYLFDKSDFIVGLGHDFLGANGPQIENSKRYADRKDPALNPKMIHHWQYESRMTLTGANATRREVLAPDELSWLTYEVARQLLGENFPYTGPNPTQKSQDLVRMATELAKTLSQNKGRSILLSGSSDPREQKLVLLVNHALGNFSKTILLEENPYLSQTGPDLLAVMEGLGSDLGAVFFLGVNPVYSHPQGKRIAELVKKTVLSVSTSLSPDETSAVCNGIVPGSHFLESWGDNVRYGRVFQLMQPTIRNLFGGRQVEDSLLAWVGSEKTLHDVVKENWLSEVASLFGKKSAPFFWENSLKKGILERPARVATLTVKTQAKKAAYPDVFKKSELFLVTYVKETIGDGSMTNNPWLLELPDPITKITWRNYVQVAPSFAKEHSLKQGEMISVSTANGTVKLPVQIQPGQHPSVLAIAVGFGRKVAGPAAKYRGANAYELQKIQDDQRLSTVSLKSWKKVAGFRELATTQGHNSLEGRDEIFQEIPLKKYLKNKDKNYQPHEEKTLWPEQEVKEHSWGMTIDLNRCTGCSACLIACQAENNISTVGEDQVIKNREMHWIRIDRYYEGSEANPNVKMQPVTCLHCDNAPCETVCPVLATVHHSEGYNQQVYNRCVGTRYCANNCPYKVRRFNWFDYRTEDKVQRMVINPDVTSRSRGVMEKCTFCVQRIQAGKLKAKMESRPLENNEIKTACQQTCPADAIQFGDLLRAESRVAKARNSYRRYDLLDKDLNTKPSVSYLKKVQLESSMS